MNSSTLSARAACAIAMLMTAPAWSIVRGGVIYTVDSTADLIDDDVSDGVCHTSANTCSLRAAVMQANVSTAPVTRIGVPAGMYVLSRPPIGADDETGGDLNVGAMVSQSRTIVIVGAGAAVTVIDANRIDRVMAVRAAATVTISGITLRNGDTRESSTNIGGGVYNEGVLTLSDCVLADNSTAGGGGIVNLGRLEILRTTIRSNTAEGGGGGGVLSGGPTIIRDSAIFGNGAFLGGGVAFTPSFGESLLAVNSTISGNYADGDGGGVYAPTGTVFLYNVSVVGNDADHDRDESGGIGGGIYAGGDARFGVVNSLIADNTILSAPIADNCNGAIEAYGLNLLDDREGCTTTTSDSHLGFVSVSTIGLLQDNGGPTSTHALLPGSEAIDSTFDELGCVDDTGAPLTTDQRGAERPAGVRCDVGAYEFGAAIPVDDLIFRNGFDGAM